MKWIYAILIFTIIGSACHVHGQTTINGELEHNSLERTYIMYVPESYNPDVPTPLLLSFHGFTSSARINFNYTKFTEIADTAGFIVIHPQGELLNGVTHWNVGGWTLGSTVDDVGFTAALLNDISSDYNIDQERIYSTGMSNGGYMSFMLACQLSSRIAAVASVTGSMTPQVFNSCAPVHPTPVLQIHGTADGTVPYTGNATWTKSIDDVLSYWVNYNMCSEEPIVSRLPNVVLEDGSIVDHHIYEDGRNCVTTEHFKIENGGHDWPGAAGNMDIDASVEVWKFLSRFDINGLIACQTTPTEEAFVEGKPISIFPNPTSDIVYIKSEESKVDSFEIYNLQGQKVLQGEIDRYASSIDLAKLSPNVYFLNVGGEVVKLVKL